MTYQTVSMTRRIAYKTKTVEDSLLAKGVATITTPGVAGLERLTYRVTLLEGQETARKLVKRGRRPSAGHPGQDGGDESRGVLRLRSQLQRGVRPHCQ
jgi:G5 domain